MFKKLGSIITKHVKKVLAPYIVECAYGTRQFEWCYNNAQEWLKYCSNTEARMYKRSFLFGNLKLIAKRGV